MIEETSAPARLSAGRFGPEAIRGKLVRAEQLARYWWAAGLAPGARVLDVGCREGYGALVLHEAGAQEVVGLDRAEAMIEVARELARTGLRFQVADPRDIPYDARSFDLVICFDLLGKGPDPAVILAELARVVAEDGLIAVSVPARASAPRANGRLPAADLDALLAGAIRYRRLLVQRDWATSAVLDGDGSDADPAEPPSPISIRDAVILGPGGQTHTIALGSHREIAEPPSIALLAEPIEVEHWIRRFEAQAEALDDHQQLLAATQALREERDKLRASLLEAESDAARIPDLEMQLEHVRHVHDVLAERLAGAIGGLNDVHGSASWRLTRPLRAVKRAIKSRFGRRDDSPATASAVSAVEGLGAGLEGSADA
jgi:SAM-dependent methyltransferase